MKNTLLSGGNDFVQMQPDPVTQIGSQCQNISEIGNLGDIKSIKPSSLPVMWSETVGLRTRPV